MSEMDPPTASPESPAPASPPARGLPLGRLVFGALILLAGVGWLLDSNDLVAVRVPWRAFAPAALILVGLALIAGARAGVHGGLVTLGVILTVLLSATSILDVRVEGGIGERVERPTAVGDIPDRYRLAVGELTLDLTALVIPPGETEVVASLGVGDLVVKVPAGASTRVVTRVSAGEINVFGRQRDGLRVRDTYTDAGFSAAPQRLSLRLSAGFGSIEVTR